MTPADINYTDLEARVARLEGQINRLNSGATPTPGFPGMSNQEIGRRPLDPVTYYTNLASGLPPNAATNTNPYGVGMRCHHCPHCGRNGES